ncbi:MAG: VOC family protein [Sulfuriferula sp.]
MLNSLHFPRFGDKPNSAFFEDYLPRLLEERDRSGLTEMIGGIEALIITVEPGNSLEYVSELSLMTPYHYLVTLDSPKHFTHVLRIDMNSPDILLREVKNPDYSDIFRNLNDMYPIGERRHHSRYLGEILLASNRHEVVAQQQAREFRFFQIGQLAELDLPINVSISRPSPYTQNVVGYMERAPNDIRVYQHGECVILGPIQAAYERGKEMQESLAIKDLILPIDHLATRVYSQNREAALLEYLALSSYYYWGSYDIKDQNSSTNVTKNVRLMSESVSPAKVFTANNLPYCVNHLDKLPSPTETFVRNYGPRLHHIALAVKDGQRNGKEHIDYVVAAITAQGKGFLLDTVGSREEGLKQIFSAASEFSSLIIEYVQRFGDFQGFFARDNVALLTFAAGLADEPQQQGDY